MNRTLAIKGVGRLKLKPDCTVISLTLRSVDKDYGKAMAESAAQLERLRAAAAGCGFAEDELKTTAFHVSTEYEGRRDKNGNYTNVFAGYACTHQLKLEFAMDTERLGKVLAAIADCVAEPQLNVAFTVRDEEAAKKALLEAACADAGQKAETLTRAAGVKLGMLVSIDYSFGTQNFVSPTAYGMDRVCMKASAQEESLAFTPDDIELKDTVSFVWELA